jgi:hypothetical protein
MDYEAFYLDSLKQIMTLRRQLRAEQVQNTLASLAKKREKSAHLLTLENNLHKELHGQNRGERIDLLIELIQDYI